MAGRWRRRWGGLQSGRVARQPASGGKRVDKGKAAAWRSNFGTEEKRGLTLRSRGRVAEAFALEYWSMAAMRSFLSGQATLKPGPPLGAGNIAATASGLAGCSKPR